MSLANRAFQQLDPLGALIGRPMTYLAAIAMPVYASVMTWFNREDIDNAPVALLAIVVVTAAGAVLVRESSPMRAPLTGRTHGLITGLTVAAYVLSAASMWQRNEFIRDDWGTVVIGVALLAMSQYRPPKEIASTGLALALFTGVVSLAQVSSLITPTPPITIALVAMWPVLAFSLASATFGRFLIDGLLLWQRRARRAADLFASDTTDWVVRSVQQDRVTILNQEIVPFFAEVLNSGSISEADRRRARSIANDIRAIMVAEVDRTWLDAIVELLAGTTDDPEKLAMRMGTDQRTAVRAVLEALAGHAAARAGGLSVTIRPQGSTCVVVISAILTGAESPIRDFAPYIAVMRIVFSSLKVDLADGRLALRFSYEQR